MTFIHGGDLSGEHAPVSDSNKSMVHQAILGGSISLVCL